MEFLARLGHSRGISLRIPHLPSYYNNSFTVLVVRNKADRHVKSMGRQKNTIKKTHSYNLKQEALATIDRCKKKNRLDVNLVGPASPEFVVKSSSVEGNIIHIGRIFFFFFFLMTIHLIID